MSSWCAGRAGSKSAAEELVRQSVRGFVGTIPGVLGVAEGHSSSPEWLEDGYHWGFSVTFATPETRDAYLNDPNHRPVADASGAAAERIVVFDI
jgi:hypothetical protein